MARSTKPRRKYRPRPVADNPITLAIRRASPIPATEIERVMEPVDHSFTAMRQGVATERHWTMLASTVEMALAIEQQGVIRGLQGHLKEAEAALRAIGLRARDGGAWQPTELYLQEIDVLDTALWLHREQLGRLSEGEWRQADEIAQRNVRGAGGLVLDARSLQADQGQLQLLESRAC